MMDALLVLVYLAATVGANLLIAAFGKTAVYPVGFFVVALTLVTRDLLHSNWSGRGGFRMRMGGVILAGGLLSYAANAGAGRIAVASFIAFTLSEAVDSFVYGRREGSSFMVRSNLSNTLSALVDSAVFLTLAFGFSLAPILAQWAVKVLGGFLVSSLIVLAKVGRRRLAVAALVLGLVAPQRASAQVLAADVAHSTTAVGTSLVVEGYAATAPLGPFRPYAIVSWGGREKPVFITETVVASTGVGAVRASADAGFVWLAFRSYKPEPVVSANASLSFGAWRLFGIASLEPRTKEHTRLFGVSRTLLFRK